MANLLKAWRAFWTILAGKEYVPALESGSEAGADEAPASDSAKIDDEFSQGAVYTLSLLQREGRLIDFLQEDISMYDDAQIGAAVRQIHQQSRKVLEKNFKLKPVYEAQEGATVEVEESYDPTVVTVIGELPDSPPYSGTLQHKGWKVTAVDFPNRVGRSNMEVVQPAEVSF